MQSLFSGAEKLGLRLVFWLKKPDPRRFKLKSPAGEEALHFMGGGSLPPPLTREEEERLVERLPDPAVKETLITRNLRLVVYIARKFEGGGNSLEDLSSIGTIGLIKAVDTFSPDKKNKLATYASRCIENEILMYLRKTSRLRSEVSFDEPLNVDWDGNELLLSDVLGSPENAVSEGLEAEAERSPSGRRSGGCPAGSGRSCSCGLAWTAAGNTPRRRSPTISGFPSPTYPGWKSGF